MRIAALILGIVGAFIIWGFSSFGALLGLAASGSSAGTFLLVASYAIPMTALVGAALALRYPLVSGILLLGSGVCVLLAVGLGPVSFGVTGLVLIAGVLALLGRNELPTPNGAATHGADPAEHRMPNNAIVIALVAAAGVTAAAYAYYFAGTTDSTVTQTTGVAQTTVVAQTAGVCLQDEEIDQALRDGASKAARELADKLLLPNSAPAYSLLTPKLQKVIPAARFDGMAKQVQASGPYRDFKVEHLYQPKAVGAATRSLCGAVSDPERRVMVEAAPDATQIHALLSAKTNNNDWAFTFWLIDDNGTWRAHAFYVSMAAMVGHDSSELLRDARAQEAKGHLINAHMLFVAANALSDRGQSFELGLKQDLVADIKKHKVPPELTGKSPFKWSLGGKDFPVDQATILGVQNKFALVLAQTSPAWNGDDLVDAEKRNRALIDAFVKTHPEYAETFGLVIAQLKGPPAKDVVYNTIFDAKTGYVEPKKEKEAKTGGK